MSEVAQPSSSPLASAWWRELLPFTLVALALRLSFLGIDAVPRFFLGDSEAYLETAFHRIPEDRSWLYGLAVNGLLHVARRLGTVLLVQTLASAALGVGIAGLCRRAGVRAWLTWTVLLSVSIEPLLLYYDRSIMTDAPGTAAVVFGVLLTGSWIVTGGRWRLAAAAACLWGAICLRTALLPLVVWVPVFLSGYALVRLARARRNGDSRRGAVHTLAGGLALLTTVTVGLGLYAVVTGRVTGRPAPTLNPRGGYFLIGLVAPILKSEDFAGLGIADPALLLEQSRHADPTLRNYQVFGSDGVVRRLEQTFGGDFWRVSQTGAALARRSIRRGPIGFARLCLLQGWEYLTFAPYRRQFYPELGLDRPLDDALVRHLRQKVKDPVAAEMPWRPSPLLSYLRGTVVWPAVLSWLALLTPGAAFVVARRSERGVRSIIVLVAGSTWIYLASVFVLSPELVQRYLLPLVPLVAFLLAVTIELALRRRAQRAMARQVASGFSDARDRLRTEATPPLGSR